jgi:DNA-binding response OmpR family regulator
MEDALRAGAQDYLVKPVNPDELMQAVSRLISAAGETVFEARRAEVSLSVTASGNRMDAASSGAG